MGALSALVEGRQGHEDYHVFPFISEEEQVYIFMVWR
jgi:hypothetical protein